MSSSDHGQTHSSHPPQPRYQPKIEILFSQWSKPSFRKKEPHITKKKKKKTFLLKALPEKFIFLSDLKEISVEILKIPKKVNKIPPNEFAFQVIRTFALISLCATLSLSPHSSDTLVFQHTRLGIPQSLCLGCPFLSALKCISSCLFNPQFGLFLLSFQSFSVL